MLKNQQKEIIYGRGGKGVKILIPDKPKNTDIGYMKQEKRKRFRLCTWIGHLKSGFRMAQNYLSGEAGIQINAFMSCAAWNLKKLMAVLNEKAARLIARFLSGPFYLIFGSFPPYKAVRKDRLYREFPAIMGYNRLVR